MPTTKFDKVIKTFIAAAFSAAVFILPIFSAKTERFCSIVRAETLAAYAETTSEQNESQADCAAVENAAAVADVKCVNDENFHACASIESELYDEPVFTVTALDKIYDFTASEIGFARGKRYLKCAEETVDKIYFDALVKPRDATLTFLPDKSEKFKITAERNGVAIDRGALLSDISAALNGGETQIRAKTEILRPEIYASDLKKITAKRAEFTTEFKNSPANRKHNIRLAARLINGSVINAGEEFSFNKVVGARTESRGFKTAKIITDGKFVDGVGGGVCQASTTLYNAAILSGMTITEQHGHSLRVSYVEPSFDAMVSSDYCDLKFKNTNNTPVFIAAEADDNRVTFTFYGIKQTEKYLRISEVVETVPPEADEIFYDDNLPFGQKVVRQKPKSGTVSEGYIATVVDGKTVKTEIIRRDKYKSVRGVVSIGTGVK